MVLVGDRGMLTEARIREEVKPAGLDWIGALRGPAIRKLVESGAVQLSLFDETDLVEVRADAYPGERLMVCRNPLLAEERARKREELLEATEKLLEPIVVATRRKKRRLTGEDKIGERVGKVIGKFKMAKHFDWHIDDNGAFGYHRNAASIAAEAALDGLYVIRTSLSESELDDQGTVRAYKRLSTVERAFRSLKSVDLKVRPVFHRTAERVRAHVLPCACWPTTWNGTCAAASRRLFEVTRIPPAPRRSAPPSSPRPGSPNPPGARPARNAPRRAGPCTASSPCCGTWPPSPRTVWRPVLPGAESFDVLARPTELQRKAFRLLGVRLQ